MERNAVCCVSHADLSLLPTVANCKSPDLSGLAWVFGPWYRGHKCVLARGCECACDEVILRVALRGIDFHRAEVAVGDGSGHRLRAVDRPPSVMVVEGERVGADDRLAQ